MIAFIDDHRGAHGVEPICKVLPIAPSTYHAHVAKRREPAKLSARARQDARLKIEVRRVFDENFRVYGVRKVWRQLKREGFDVARCTVSRLMRDMDLQGAIRGKPVKTTISNLSEEPRSMTIYERCRLSPREFCRASASVAYQIGSRLVGIQNNSPFATA
jgi:HTH-like domain